MVFYHKMSPGSTVNITTILFSGEYCQTTEDFLQWPRPDWETIHKWHNFGEFSTKIWSNFDKQKYDSIADDNFRITKNLQYGRRRTVLPNIINSKLLLNTIEF